MTMVTLDKKSIAPSNYILLYSLVIYWICILAVSSL